MRVIFYISIIGLILFEIANVFFIMPLPGSQEMNSMEIAYFLHISRWYFRLILGVLFLSSLFIIKWKYKSIPFFASLTFLVIFYLFNFKMSADHMFYQPNKILMKSSADNKVDSFRLVIGVDYHGKSRAYPIQFIGYHHQLIDTIDGDRIMVTYCTVCRSGRVYLPMIGQKNEEFRLVGMDHFNALFEDKSTRSWWQQESGKAIAGPLKGRELQELFSQQMSLSKWLEHYPQSLIMQPDPNFQIKYDSLSNYEISGKSKLTKIDSASWNKKSLVVGVKVKNDKKVYDWNLLKKERIIHDFIDSIPIILILSDDNKSFFAFERFSSIDTFLINNDTLINKNLKFNINGTSIKAIGNEKIKSLVPVQAYQEFWHSWQTFNPKLN